MKRLTLVLAVAGLLAACTIAPVPLTGPGPPPPAPNASAASAASAQADAGAGAGATAPAESDTVSAATRALLTQSQTERAAGNLGGAAATVERGLTIAPDEALLWVELAEIRMAQGDAVLAQEMARKALTLTSPNSAEAARARRLITR